MNKLFEILIFKKSEKLFKSCLPVYIIWIILNVYLKCGEDYI